MGFMDDVRAQMGDKQFDAHFEGITIDSGKLKYKRKKWDIAGCEAMVDQGANIASRVTATRVAVGTVLLPGIGTLIGAMAKKNRSKVFLAITTPDGDMITVELKAKREGKAREFAAKVNRAAAHFADAQAKEAPPTENSAPAVEAATAPPPPSVPAGWYPQGDIQRYWDGQQWTDQTAPLPPAPPA